VFEQGSFAGDRLSIPTDMGHKRATTLQRCFEGFTDSYTRLASKAALPDANTLH
jgi:hypothetical protein